MELKTLYVFLLKSFRPLSIDRIVKAKKKKSDSAKLLAGTIERTQPIRGKRKKKKKENHGGEIT